MAKFKGLFRQVFDDQEQQETITVKEAVENDKRLGKAYKLLGLMAEKLGIEKPLVEGVNSHWLTRDALETVINFIEEIEQ